MSTEDKVFAVYVTFMGCGIAAIVAIIAYAVFFVK